MKEAVASQQLDPGGNKKFYALPLVLLMAAQIGTSGDNGTLSIATGEITTALGARLASLPLPLPQICLFSRGAADCS